MRLIIALFLVAVIVTASGETDQMNAIRIQLNHNVVHQHTLPKPAAEIIADFKQIALKTVEINNRSEIEGYKMGLYPNPLRGMVHYSAPKSVIRVSKDNLSTFVSPHFKLGQFLCKADAGWPKFVVLEARLLAQLEWVVQRLSEQGIVISTLNILSGYRTPIYNAALGNGAHSRHIYGDAVDFFVDADNNGWIDDLNGDGLTDIKDAHWLSNLIESKRGGFAGGLAVYPANAYHGPFVHIDMRGEEVRWGAREQ